MFIEGAILVTLYTIQSLYAIPSPKNKQEGLLVVKLCSPQTNLQQEARDEHFSTFTMYTA